MEEPIQLQNFLRNSEAPKSAREPNQRNLKTRKENKVFRTERINRGNFIELGYFAHGLFENMSFRRGDKVEYEGVPYFFQPNGSSCYLYVQEEDIGFTERAKVQPSILSISPVVQLSVSSIYLKLSPSGTSKISLSKALLLASQKLDTVDDVVEVSLNESGEDILQKVIVR
jgi:hypothetical protein